MLRILDKLFLFAMCSCLIFQLEGDYRRVVIFIIGLIVAALTLYIENRKVIGALLIAMAGRGPHHSTLCRSNRSHVAALNHQHLSERNDHNEQEVQRPPYRYHSLGPPRPYPWPLQMHIPLKPTSLLAMCPTLRNIIPNWRLLVSVLQGRIGD